MPLSPIVNAMSVDVEDYFHVSAFARQISPGDWESFPPRVQENTERIGALFAEHGVHATFFVLAWVAQRYPGLIRHMVASGHEIGSHGCAHVRVDRQSEAEFQADAARSKAILEDLAGKPVYGYRAANFSIGPATPWAYSVLADAGYAYSSSVYPIRHDHYGVPDGPRFPYSPLPGTRFVEIPIATATLLGRHLPCGGGGYFRLLPYRVSSATLHRLIDGDHRPAVFYFHPWEIDPTQPRIRHAPLSKRWRHYVALRHMEGKLRRLLTDHAWDRIDHVFTI